jgi:hypothetical protein
MTSQHHRAQAECAGYNLEKGKHTIKCDVLRGRDCAMPPYLFPTLFLSLISLCVDEAENPLIIRLSLYILLMVWWQHCNGVPGVPSSERVGVWRVPNGIIISGCLYKAITLLENSQPLAIVLSLPLA